MGDTALTGVGGARRCIWNYKAPNHTSSRSTAKKYLKDDLDRLRGGETIFENIGEELADDMPLEEEDA